MNFSKWLNEAFKPIYKLTWLTDNGKETSQNFPSIDGLLRQEKWLKEKGWKIIKAQKRIPYKNWEQLKD